MTSTKKQLIGIALFTFALSVTFFTGCHRDPQPTVVTTTASATPPPQKSTPPPPPPPTPSEPSHLPVETVWQDIPLFINYPTGGARLNDEARALLREAHSSMIHRTDIVRIAVHGHADGRGSASSNEALARERAQGVVDFLVGDLGMPRELFEIHGHGSDAPITSGQTASDRLLNRRVQFRILVRRQAAL